ncbi:MAG: class III extradiol ring-cleavage dioxygenase [Acidobacteriota bacterium]
MLQVSLPPGIPPGDLVGLGRALRPLRERGVVAIGSGGIVHNLGRVAFDERDAPVDAWASAFDDWVRDRVADRDDDTLLAYYDEGPAAALAVPTTEHLDPLFFVLGLRGDDDVLTVVHEGFQHANLSMRTFAFAPSNEG